LQVFPLAYLFSFVSRWNEGLGRFFGSGGVIFGQVLGEPFFAAVVTPMRDARASQGYNENYWQQRKAYNEQDNQGHKKQQQSFLQNQLRRSNSKEGSPASTAAKKGSPNTCPNITPPDPKNLPKPSFQRETKENRYASGKTCKAQRTLNNHIKRKVLKEHIRLMTCILIGV
jgi:hypothetical protein